MWPAVMLVLLAAGVIWTGGATGQGDLVRIGSAPRLPSGTVDLGQAPSTAALSGAVALRPRNERALEAFIASVTDRDSPAYGHYLGKGQFAARFGPAPATVQAVQSRLRAEGLQVGVSAGGLLVRFSGSASRVSAAFATTLDTYRLRSGRVLEAATGAPALPEALAGSVLAVEGLDGLARTGSSRVRRKASLAARFPAARSASFPHPAGSPEACPEARTAASREGGLTDDQIAHAYGAFGLYGVGDTGAGVHIGVFEEEPFSVSDMQHFDSCYFGAKNARAMIGRLHVISLEGGLPAGPGSGGEALLDIEDVSAMAPGSGNRRLREP